MALESDRDDDGTVAVRAGGIRASDTGVRDLLGLRVGGASGIAPSVVAQARDAEGPLHGDVTTRPIYFLNKYWRPVRVAILIRAPECADAEAGGVGWKVKGWYGIEPDESRRLFTSRNSVFAFYAKSDDSAVFWHDTRPGSQWWYVHPYRNFEHCAGIGISFSEPTSDPSYVGFVTVDISNQPNALPYTHRLLPP